MMTMTMMMTLMMMMMMMTMMMTILMMMTITMMMMMMAMMITREDEYTTIKMRLQTTKDNDAPYNDGPHNNEPYDDKGPFDDDGPYKPAGSYDNNLADYVADMSLTRVSVGQFAQNCVSAATRHVKKDAPTCRIFVSFWRHLHKITTSSCLRDRRAKHPTPLVSARRRRRMR